MKGYGPFFLENRLNEANFYAEDSWRVHPSLTVNLGLRYEYVSAPKEKEDRIDYGIGADTEQLRAAPECSLDAAGVDRVVALVERRGHG